MNPPIPAKSELQAGTALLARPLLPLVRLVQLLYLAGPFARISEVVEQLAEPLETSGIHYPEPNRLLAPYLDLLAAFEELKAPAAATGANHGGQEASKVIDEAGQPLAMLEALEYRVGHAVLSRELETINSLLCAPCRCHLCCIGPDPGMSQEFFEIPLSPEETTLFPLPRIDTPESRAAGSADEPPLTHQGREFYRGDAALCHWRHGWSLILPAAGRCPQLDQAGGCRIYPQRPAVCRRPQIFSYLLEEQPTPALYVARRKLLAVWDCPYVRSLKEEIAAFAENCGLEPVFRHNKS